jgi:hypothetical protein
MFQASFEGRAYLLLANILRGVPFPFVFNLASMIPIWNHSLEDYMETIFFFVERFFFKRGRIILFYPNDLRVQKEIASFVDVYKFTIKLKWIVINALPIISTENKTCKVCYSHHLNHLFSLCI